MGLSHQNHPLKSAKNRDKKIGFYLCKKGQGQKKTMSYRTLSKFTRQRCWADIPLLAEMWKLPKVTVDEPYFVQSENKLFVFYDLPHLLMSVRNNLQKHNFMLDDHILCWAYLQKLYQIESSKTTMLRLAQKLTQRHIDLPAFSII